MLVSLSIFSHHFLTKAQWYYSIIFIIVLTFISVFRVYLLPDVIEKKDRPIHSIKESQSVTRTKTKASFQKGVAALKKNAF